jgi:hypothetical protein
MAYTAYRKRPNFFTAAKQRLDKWLAMGSVFLL